MARYDFGKFGVTNAGTYNEGTTYAPLTQVEYNEAIWISTQASTGNTPSLESKYWQLVTKKGDPGPAPILSKYEVYINSSAWSGNSAPYYFDLANMVRSLTGNNYDENLYVDAYFNNGTATSKQIIAYLAADIYGRGKQMLYAYGEKPTENLPYIIAVEAGQVTTSSSGSEEEG